MSLPTSLAAYEDCAEQFERAAASAKGIRILFSDETQALNFRFRMNMARKLLRAEACRIYDPEDTRYGKCEYDGLKVRIVPTAENDGKAWVYIEPHSAQILEVEELDADSTGTELS